MTLDELAHDFRNIERWERGEGGPTYSQLEGLADKLKVPVAVFFFPRPPAVPPIEETFRTLPDATIEELPSKVRLLLRKAKALQLNLVELCAGRNQIERLITRDLVFRPSDSVEQMAGRVREYLGISLEIQTQWPNDDHALKAWRDAVQRVGIFVFKDAFKVADFSGFCLTHEEFPIIYVNNSAAKTRQIFTIAHELAHLLFQTSGVDSLNELPTRSAQARNIEIACNRFAAELLLPNEAFENARRGLPATEATIERIASLFRVSRESVLRRYLDRGEVSQVFYEEAANRWANERREGSGGDYYRTKLAYLGREYVGLALSAFHQARIDERKLADYLDTRPRNISGLEERYIEGAAA